ncbi:hypothetical protein [Paludisphaera mucosa]|uniref:Uncharacterized protein n=1 Tax=Paludisphaera mucosa TaxID=3030827 RepID=A0ABT6FID3_9BACT|nr:hypothetical protein [Paludisphaera mucosa]MDG3007335.1 hypothetical protein [Paludisphaera mucosa]
MRTPSRLVPGLLGLALAASAADAVGQDSFAPGPQAAPIVLEHGTAPAGPSRAYPGRTTAAAPKAAKHEHKGLFGSRSCTQCQRARAMARDGVNVPPPPAALPPGALPAGVAGHHGHAHPKALAAAPGSTGCASCEADAAAMGGTIVPGSIVVTDVHPAGKAVVGGGGEAVAAEFPTGRAVVGGGDPTPVGVARASQGNFTPAAGNMAAGPQPGLRDPSVMPSGMVPPAQTAVGGKEAGRPRIVKHLLDLPDLSRIGRGAREGRVLAERSAHASISYGDAAGPVTELPASMVFGKGGR